MKKFVLILIVMLLILVLPILHQNIGGSNVHFSIVDSIQMDMSEQQFNTLYFIINSFKF